MQKLSKSGDVRFDQTSIMAKEETLDFDRLSTSPCLVHISQFLANAEALINLGAMGVWLDADDDAQLLERYGNRLEVIGVNFPMFMDGRGFSHARILKGNSGFKGELVAIGNFMQDQLFFLKRCGYDAFLIPDDADVESMKVSLDDFQSTYQASTDDSRPLYRKRLTPC